MAVRPYITQRFRLQKQSDGKWGVYERRGVHDPERFRPELSISTGVMQTESYLRSQFPFSKISRTYDTKRKGSK